MKILIVLTSHGVLGDTGKPTGFWLEEFTSPYYVFKDTGAEVVLASPKGGQPPVDPRSEAPDAQTDSTKRFKQDRMAQAALTRTAKLSSISPDDFDAVFYPGGHGPLWDLAENPRSIEIIETMHADGKPVGAVCHGPAAFRHARAPNDTHLVRGKSVTGFSNTEEEAIGLTSVVPFLVEDMLRHSGGRYSKARDWQSHTVIDGNLITGQNPASSKVTATALLRGLINRSAIASRRTSMMRGAAEPRKA